MRTVKKISLKQIKELLLNTPEKYWLIVRGKHIHKSFWGVTLTGGSVASWLTTQSLLITGGLLTVGLAVIGLSIAGHIYTGNKPYFKLWDNYFKRHK